MDPSAHRFCAHPRLHAQGLFVVALMHYFGTPPPKKKKKLFYLLLCFILAVRSAKNKSVCRHRLKKPDIQRKVRSHLELEDMQINPTLSTKVRHNAKWINPLFVIFTAIQWLSSALNHFIWNFSWICKWKHSPCTSLLLACGSNGVSAISTFTICCLVSPPDDADPSALSSLFHYSSASQSFHSCPKTIKNTSARHSGALGELLLH